MAKSRADVISPLVAKFSTAVDIFLSKFVPFTKSETFHVSFSISITLASNLVLVTRPATFGILFSISINFVLN